MSRYLSSFTSRIDAKGRVSIPAPFRTVLARDGFDGLCCFPDLDQPALNAGGNALLAEIDAVLATIGSGSIERDRIAAAMFGTSEILKVDPEGRISVSESAKAHAAIADTIAFVGLGHKFQLWQPDRFQHHLEEARAAARAMRKRPEAVA